MFIFFFTSSAFYRYLSLARQVPGAPARTVTDTQTDTRTHMMITHNLAPSRAMLTKLSSRVNCFNQKWLTKYMYYKRFFFLPANLAHG